MENLLVFMLLLMLFFAGMVLLQIFLSKRESRFAGLALPMISLIMSLVAPLNFATPSGGVDVGTVGALLLAWLAANIPTLILLAIYFACRGKQRRKRQMDRLNIQDI